MLKITGCRPYRPSEPVQVGPVTRAAGQRKHDPGQDALPASETGTTRMATEHRHPRSARRTRQTGRRPAVCGDSGSRSTPRRAGARARARPGSVPQAGRVRRRLRNLRRVSEPSPLLDRAGIEDCLPASARPARPARRGGGLVRARWRRDGRAYDSRRSTRDVDAPVQAVPGATTPLDILRSCCMETLCSDTDNTPRRTAFTTRMVCISACSPTQSDASGWAGRERRSSRSARMPRHRHATSCAYLIRRLRSVKRRS